MMEKISFQGINKDTLYGFVWKTKQEKPLGNIIIVTGMAECAYRYDDFASYLANHGYDVYCFDHYGQGENVSDIKDLGKVPKSFFSRSVKNIDTIVSSLRVTCLPTYIFAHSMGSFMLQDYIQRYTHHINKVIICGSNGPNAKLLYAAGYKLARLLVHKSNRNLRAKLLHKLAIGTYSSSIKNRKTDCDWLSYNQANVKAYKEDPKCGFVPTNGFYLEFLKGNNRLYKRKFLKKIRSDMNVLIIGGKDDPVGAYGKGLKALAKLYTKLGIQHIETIIYPNMRHEILNEDGKMHVYEDVLKFIQLDDGVAERIISKK